VGELANEFHVRDCDSDLPPKTLQEFPRIDRVFDLPAHKDDVPAYGVSSGVSFLPYSYSFYPLELCSIGFELWVVYEVFKTVFEPYDALRRSWR